jgi:hypothetical protein
VNGEPLFYAVIQIRDLWASELRNRFYAVIQIRDLWASEL